jgi:hypothetical protein
MTHELHRKGSTTVILALHPGEVATSVHFLFRTKFLQYVRWPKTLMLMPISDMANIDVDWEVDGILTPKESIAGMLPVIMSKGIEQNGTFWTWEGNVSGYLLNGRACGEKTRAPQG